MPVDVGGPRRQQAKTKKSKSLRAGLRLGSAAWRPWLASTQAAIWTHLRCGRPIWTRPPAVIDSDLRAGGHPGLRTVAGGPRYCRGGAPLHACVAGRRGWAPLPSRGGPATGPATVPQLLPRYGCSGAPPRRPATPRYQQVAGGPRYYCV